MSHEMPSPDSEQVPIRRGDIYMVDWSPGRGSEQAGVRPAVIVQHDALNANPRYPNTIVVAISRSGRSVPTHIVVPRSDQNGLAAALSYVKCEQLQTLAKERLGERLGRLSDDQVAGVRRALRRALALA